MTGCVTGGSADLLRRLDAVVEGLVPALSELLARLGLGDAVISTLEDSTQVLSVPLRFPDGVGEGRLEARVFRYRTSARVDITLLHNRVIAFADGRPTDRSCFLNDFVASVTLGPDSTTLPTSFVELVEEGVRSALSAVDEHNRRNSRPWSQIQVAAR